MTNVYSNIYLRPKALPHTWCPGCGHGIIIHGLVAAIDKLGLDQDRVVIVGGIGCSGRTAFMLDFNTMHTTHGRAIAFATGIKLVRPELTVILTLGDGDALAIGGNHFLHAARRNIDLTAVIYNNSIYGMTGGQLAPTTPMGKRSVTAPHGGIEPSVDIVKLVIAAGATYVARTTTFDFQEVPRLIERAIAHRGFSVVDILTPCPTYYGRLNHPADPYQMIHEFKRMTVPVEEAESMTVEELGDRWVTGEFVCEDRPEYTELYRQMCRKMRPGEGKPSDDRSPRP
ncbi:MAG: 2-oxoacid:ferredoxin oxidoreductase subunit beta [Candidatus Bipolaricaulia bacterium]